MGWAQSKVNQGNGDFRRPGICRSMSAQVAQFARGPNCLIAQDMCGRGKGFVAIFPRSALSDRLFNVQSQDGLRRSALPLASPPTAPIFILPASGASARMQRWRLLVQAGVLQGNFTGWRSSFGSGVCSVGSPRISVGSSGRGSKVRGFLGLAGLGKVPELSRVSRSSTTATVSTSDVLTGRLFSDGRQLNHDSFPPLTLSLSVACCPIHSHT
jgi:hypothetical protein